MTRLGSQPILVINLFTILAGLTPLRAEIIQTATADGGAVYGETYYGDVPADAPLIHLFHMAGADGRGEYAPLAPWLNSIGYRAIAWDLRSGGNRFGLENRTAAAYDQEALSYCDALPDMEAALTWSDSQETGPIAVWGSSYSAALVFRLGAQYPERVAAVVAASPASGDPMEGCRAEDVLDEITVPVLALRPQREMEFTMEQAETLKEAGIDFHIVENGVHGSLMLQDDRTKKDMSADRVFVANWLARHLDKEDR